MIYVFYVFVRLWLWLCNKNELIFVFPSSRGSTVFLCTPFCLMKVFPLSWYGLKSKLFHSQGMKISNSYLVLNMIIRVFEPCMCECDDWFCSDNAHEGKTRRVSKFAHVNFLVYFIPLLNLSSFVNFDGLILNRIRF